MKKDKLRDVWSHMKQRCNNPKCRAYARYGGRGITCCDEWREYPAFYDWAVSNGYAEGLSLDRIDPNGNYEPSNCRWITIQEQQRNKERTIYAEVNGEVRTLAEWAELSGLLYRTIRYRYERGIRGEALIDKENERTKAAVKVEIKGEIHTLEEWARLSGVQIRTLRKRYERGVRGEDLIDKENERKKEAMKVEINGEVHTFKEWERVSGVLCRTMRMRYEKGIRGEELLEQGYKKKG